MELLIAIISDHEVMQLHFCRAGPAFNIYSHSAGWPDQIFLHCCWIYWFSRFHHKSQRLMRVDDRLTLSNNSYGTSRSV